MVFPTAEQGGRISLKPGWRSLEELCELQSIRLRRMVGLVAKRHPWYRQVLADSQIELDQIDSISKLTLLPLTSKQTFVENAASFRLEPDPDKPEDYVLADVAYTAGTTTGEPTPIFQTARDLRAILFAQLRMARIRGMQPGDRVVNLYPLAPYPHGGWIRPTQASAVLGAPVVAATGGARVGEYPINRGFEDVADLVASTDPDVVWGVPSYIVRLFQHMKEEKLQAPSLRMIAVSGEPCGKQLRNTLMTLAAEIGASNPMVSDSLGASELQFSFIECPSGEGFHNPAPELVYVETVDDAGERVVNGEPGRLAYTHLDRTGTALLRYLVGDRASLDTEPCPECGWLGGRIVEHLGREDNFVKVRGNLVNIDSAHRAVESVPGVRDHRLTVCSNEGMDSVEAEIALDVGADPELTEEEVKRVFRRATSIRPEVSLVNPSDIWEPNQRMKPKRFIDLRRSGNVEADND